MAYFLYQVAYTPESWAMQAESVPDVRHRVQATIENLGGSIEALWYAFGEYDVVAIIKFPDNISMAATAIAFAAGGALKAAKTTPRFAEPPTMSGLPRRAGLSRSSTEAKKASISMCKI